MTRTDIAVLTTVATIALIAALAGNAAADAVTCIDTHHPYRVRALNQHDALVLKTLGEAKPPVRITTTCINLLRADNIGLSSRFNCLGTGDVVAAASIDGRGESCLIAKIKPFAPEEGDLPEKK